MATPEDRPAPTEVQWSRLPNYGPTDNDGQHVCAMTGFQKRDGESIYRGPFIDEFYGWFAIGQDAAEDLAKLIGWVDPDTLVSTQKDYIRSLEEANAELKQRLDDLSTAIKDALS